MTQGKFFFNSKQTDCLHIEWLADIEMFPGNVYCLLGVILPELLVTHEKEQTSGHELWLLTYRSLYRLIMNLLRKKNSWKTLQATDSLSNHYVAGRTLMT